MPSPVRRALAALVLVIVAVIAFRIVVGFITGLFWIVALVALAVAAVWAVTTLKSAKRARVEKKSERRVGRAPARPVVTAAAPDDRVEAQMVEIKEQLRKQGRL